MKNLLIFLCLVFLLCNGCKYFRKSSPPLVDTITADTLLANDINVDSAAYYSNLNNTGVNPAASAIKGKYYMIVGCFNVKLNAEKYVTKLKGLGYDAQIISGSHNFQMVSARAYNNYNESISEIDKFRNDVTPNAWVFLKK
jgi:hypothetical protein